LDFPFFMKTIAARVATQPTIMADAAAACQKHGVPTLPALASRLDLIPAVLATLGVQV